jgi:SAM-dependent methyltransferase
MSPKYKYIALGLLSCVPGLHTLLRRGTGGTTSARYCYSVWLRHLVLNARVNPSLRFRSVAELGPGDSIGIGLAALLSGAERYFALDALPHAQATRNRVVFDELIELFRARAPIPGDDEFPEVLPRLDGYSFPAQLLTDELLERALAPQRLQRIREDIGRLQGSVSYLPRWYERGQIAAGSVDLILSQAVLEHVDALEGAYEAMSRWLSPGGFMSHQIDFKCHSMAEKWNGHLAYSELTWRFMRGRLPYLLNRRVLAEHCAAARAVGFDDIVVRRFERDDGLPAAALAPRFRTISAEDVRTAGAFLQAAQSLRRVFERT